MIWFLVGVFVFGGNGGEDIVRGGFLERNIKGDVFSFCYLFGVRFWSVVCGRGRGAIVVYRAGIL